MDSRHIGLLVTGGVALGFFLALGGLLFRFEQSLGPIVAPLSLLTK